MSIILIPFRGPDFKPDTPLWIMIVYGCFLLAILGFVGWMLFDVLSTPPRP